MSFHGVLFYKSPLDDEPNAQENHVAGFAVRVQRPRGRCRSSEKVVSGEKSEVGRQGPPLDGNRVEAGPLPQQPAAGHALVRRVRVHR